MLPDRKQRVFYFTIGVTPWLLWLMIVIALVFLLTLSNYLADWLAVSMDQVHIVPINPKK